MLQHLITLLYRNLSRSRFTFFINLLGLSTGLAGTLLIYLWVSDEVNVDKFHEKDAHLFQVVENVRTNTGIDTREPTPFGMGYVLTENFSEVEFAATVTPTGWLPKFTIEKDGVRLKNEGRFVGQNFFQLFSYTLLHGDRKTVLQDKNAMVISASLAKKLFKSTEEAIGKSIPWQLSDIMKTCTVTGVVQDVPANSSESFDVLFSIDLLGEIMGMSRDDLQAPGPNTYVVLRDGADVKAFNKTMSLMMADRTGNKSAEFFVTSYSDRYLYGKFENGVPVGTRIIAVKFFVVIAVIILLIACINFMNLTTAKASRRLKEIGIKKVVGASRSTLVVQYMSESIIIALLSLVTALGLVIFMLPQFNLLTGKQLSVQLDVSSIAAYVSIALTTGLVAGSYPAFYLSGFKPIAVLKGKLTRSVSELLVRKGLVVFQFLISTVAIVAVLIIHQQMAFVQSRDLGYDKDNIIYFELEGNVATDHNTFIKELKQTRGVENASSMVKNIVGEYGPPFEVTYEDRKIPFHELDVDYGMIETLGLTVSQGRAFNADFTDTSRLVLNQAAIDAMGITEPIGKVIRFGGKRVEIIGVINNFHFSSLHDRIGPLAIRLETQRLSHVLVKIQEGSEQETVAGIEAMYKKFNPGFALDYRFLDSEYQNLYASEQRMALLSKWFAVLAIVVSALGLFALAAFTAERRTKEIGIRKVLGSTDTGIAYLLCGDFVRLVAIAIVVSVPVSYFVMRAWLQNFAYAVEINVWYFVMGAVATMAIALFATGGQAVRASMVNPADSLRAE